MSEPTREDREAAARHFGILGSPTAREWVERGDEGVMLPAQAVPRELAEAFRDHRLAAERAITERCAANLHADMQHILEPSGKRPCCVEAARAERERARNALFGAGFTEANNDWSIPHGIPDVIADNLIDALAVIIRGEST